MCSPASKHRGARIELPSHLIIIVAHIKIQDERSRARCSDAQDYYYYYYNNTHVTPTFKTYKLCHEIYVAVVLHFIYILPH